MNVRTLLLANAVADVCMLLALALYLRKRKTYPGFRCWVAATSISLVAGVSFGLRGVLPDLISISLGVVAYPLAGVMRLMAVRAFLGLRPASKAWFALPALSLAVGLSLAYTVGAPQWRSLAVSLAAIIPGAHICYLWLHRAPANEALFHRIMAGMLSLLLVVLLARTLLALADPGFHLLQETMANLMFPLVLLPTHLLMNMLFLMLNSQRLEMELREAQAEVKALGGLLPICAKCKSVRDDQGYWSQIESYLSKHSDARFTHGLCPNCVKEFFPGYTEPALPPGGQDPGQGGEPKCGI